MASLDVARHAASVGAWHTILGVERGAAAAQIRKACRTLQRDAHPDKGGSPELSQLINRARDALLGQCPETARQRAARRDVDMEEERRAEVAQRAEDQRKRDAAEAEKLAERERTRRVALQRSFRCVPIAIYASAISSPWSANLSIAAERLPGKSSMSRLCR